MALVRGWGGPLPARAGSASCSPHNRHWLHCPHLARRGRALASPRSWEAREARRRRGGSPAFGALSSSAGAAWHLPPAGPDPSPRRFPRRRHRWAPGHTHTARTRKGAPAVPRRSGAWGRRASRASAPTLPRTHGSPSSTGGSVSPVVAPGPRPSGKEEAEAWAEAGHVGTALHWSPENLSGVKTSSPGSVLS